MPKDIGGLLVSKLKDTRLAYFHYLKMTWGAPTGIKRWTTTNPWPRQVDSRNIEGHHGGLGPRSHLHAYGLAGERANGAVHLRHNFCECRLRLLGFDGPLGRRNPRSAHLALDGLLRQG